TAPRYFFAGRKNTRGPPFGTSVLRLRSAHRSAQYTATLRAGIFVLWTKSLDDRRNFSPISLF
ncbi:MAG: hypothetical protein ACLFR1_12465, partial [Spirochaetia bacterium]